jgi:ribosomal protein S18 acetylase RimI-like enzyme
LTFARSLGYRRISLHTLEELKSARRLYRRAGFQIAATESHEKWGRPVVEETWELNLE